MTQSEPADQQVEGRSWHARAAGNLSARWSPIAGAVQSYISLGDFQMQRFGRRFENALPVNHRTQTARLQPGEGKTSAGQTEPPRLQHAVFPRHALQVDLGP